MPRMLQVRGLSDDVYWTLQQRAAREGRTLSALLRDELIQIAVRPSRRDLYEGMGEQASVAASDEAST